MSKYNGLSYYQLRRTYRSAPEEDKMDLSLRIMNYYRVMVERFVENCNPDWSIGERKSAVFERIYRNDFSADEMLRIKTSIVAYYQQKQV